MLIQYAYCHLCYDGVLVTAWPPSVEETVCEHLKSIHLLAPGSPEMVSALNKIRSNVRAEYVSCRSCEDDRPKETR